MVEDCRIEARVDNTPTDRTQTAISPSQPPLTRTDYVAVRNANTTPGCLSSPGPCKGQG